jgi:hypothetical protein
MGPRICRVFFFICLMHFGTSPWRIFKVTMTEEERKRQLEKLVRETMSLQHALKANDPSLARGVYSDKELNLLCDDCPYVKKM